MGVVMIVFDTLYQSPLRIAILGVLWREGRLPLWRVERAVAIEYKPVHRSTVSTTLTRMIACGLITRCERHYYRAAMTKEQLIEHVTTAIVTVIEEA